MQLEDAWRRAGEKGENLKEAQAKKLAPIIKKEIERFISIENKRTSYSLDAAFVVTARAPVGKYGGRIDKEMWAVEVRTDSDVYDLIYDPHPSYRWRFRERLNQIVNNYLKTPKGTHYFENEGQGIMLIY